MPDPFTPWQRMVSKLLPWFDLEAEAQRIAKTDEIVAKVSRIESVRIAYRQAGVAVERRKVPR